MRLTLSIERDENPSNPRKEFDHLGTMVCNHRRYNLGDIQDGNPHAPEGSVWLGLYLYDHSGITMSWNPFSCRWDSGVVGVIYVTREDIIKEYGSDSIDSRKRALECLKGEVKEYDQYLTGDVWGYVIKDEGDNHVDSCWGLYGRDYCVTEGESALKHEQNRQELVERETAIAECMP
jgi:hypothetical protein